ncbi:MAG: arginase family protein [Desulfobacteraceae bacterium]|nr:arginase family protein [Desulfobacteraceae bacterium]
MENSILLTPFFLDQSLPGLISLAKPGWAANRPALPQGGNPQAAMSIVHKGIARHVEKILNDGNRPVSIAGDCCTAIGVLAGIQRTGIDPHLIWFDAHGDFNTRETSPSGFLGGMPLAMMVGRGEQTMAQAVGLDPIPEERVILTDGRDLDPEERDAIDASAIVHMARAEALLDLPLPPGPIYVHVDLDIVPAEEMPAHNYPASGGPSTDVLHKFFERLNASGRVVAVSVSTWNPDLDRDGRSERIGLSLIASLVGE